MLVRLVELDDLPQCAMRRSALGTQGQPLKASGTINEEWDFVYLEVIPVLFHSSEIKSPFIRHLLWYLSYAYDNI